MVSCSWHGHTIEARVIGMVGARFKTHPNLLMLSIDGRNTQYRVAPQESILKIEFTPTVARFEIEDDAVTHCGVFEWQPMYGNYRMVIDDEEIDSGVLKPEVPWGSCGVVAIAGLLMITTFFLLAVLHRSLPAVTKKQARSDRWRHGLTSGSSRLMRL